MGEQIAGLRWKCVPREATRGQLDLGAPDSKLLEQVPRAACNLRGRSPPAPDAVELESEADEPVAFASQALGQVQADERAELVDQSALTPVSIPEVVRE